MDLKLRGKKVLITGGSKGIGLACAQGFAAEGAIVHIASRSQPDLKTAADAIARQYKTEVFIHPMDLGKTENAIALGKICGDVDILVNNAGAIPSGGLLEVTDEKWRHAWDLKVFGFINLTREIYRCIPAGRSCQRRLRRRCLSSAQAAPMRCRISWSISRPRERLT